MKTKIFLLLFFFSASCFSQTYLDKEFDRITDSVLSVNPLIPGMLVSYVCGDFKWEKAKGYADIDKKIPMRLDNTYRIGSVTKTFTISVLLQLVDEGKVSLDDNISRFFPDIPNGENITVKMLANMRSGLYNYSESQQFDDTLTNRPSKVWSDDELIQLALKYPPYFPPDSNFHYSNTNTILIGKIIEKVTGNKWQDEIKKRIFEPLELKNTWTANGRDMIGDYSHGYMQMDSTSSKLTDVTSYYDVSWASAAGDIISDINDIKIYLRALGTGKFYSEKMREARKEWAITHGNLKYGLGMFSVSGFLGHNGGIPGFTNFSGYNPESDCSIIVVYNTQRPGADMPDELAKRLLQVAGY
ncbi:MAG: beta-lactamase family protein [Bacteroidetes bacterium]|nr:beta-lactamase family protein [Bacteroidota bacterium]